MLLGEDSNNGVTLCRAEEGAGHSSCGRGLVWDSASAMTHAWQSQYLEDRGRKNKCLPLHSLCSTSNQTQDLVHARTSTLSTETHHQHLNILHLFSCLKYLFIIPHSSPLFLQEKTKQTPLPPPHSLCSVYHYTQPHAGCPMHSVPLCSASCNMPCA